MFNSFLILSFITFACANVLIRDNFDSVNENTDLVVFPQLASLRKFGVHSCSGTILRNNIILTVATCLLYINPSSLSIQYGSNNDIVDVKNYKLNPDHNPVTKYANLGMVILKSNITFSDTVRPIELAQQTPDVNTEEIVYNWNQAINENVIPLTNSQRVNVKVVDQSSCQKQYPSVEITDEMLCAEVNGNESNDCLWMQAGAPMIIDGKQIGLVSLGVKCARSGQPIIYTNLASFNNWIEETVKAIEAEN